MKKKYIGEVKTLGTTIMCNVNHYVDIPDGKYEIEIKDISKSRTLSQNGLMWELIGLIATKQDGWRANKEETYNQLLQRASAKTIQFGVVPDAIEMIKSSIDYRGHKVLHRYYINDKPMDWIEVYVGTSKMDTKEMTKVIDVALDWCYELDIETQYYQELIKEFEKNDKQKK